MIWHSVAERLPKPHRMCLVIYARTPRGNRQGPRRQVVAAQFCKDGLWRFYSGGKTRVSHHVTHWSYWPKPPKEQP